MKKDSSEQSAGLREHLVSQFKSRAQRQAPPDELKIQVFKTIDHIQLMTDMFELFTIDFADSELKMIDLMSRGLDLQNRDVDPPED